MKNKSYKREKSGQRDGLLALIETLPGGIIGAAPQGAVVRFRKQCAHCGREYSVTGASQS